MKLYTALLGRTKTAPAPSSPVAACVSASRRFFLFKEKKNQIQKSFFVMVL
jgi:hypothetical protein